MDHTEEHFARLGVFLLDVGFHHVGQRHVARLVALHNLTARLVDDDDMVIFVNDLHIKKSPSLGGKGTCFGVTCSCRHRPE